MTPKQERFVQEYLIDLNATQAAIRAGYSPRGAAVTGAKLLTNAKIQDAIQTKEAELSRRTGVSQDRVIRELCKIAFQNSGDFIDFQTGEIRQGASREDLSCVSGVKVKNTSTDTGESSEREVRTYDKIRALELLGKHFGMFTDRLRVDGTLPVTIVGADSLED